MRIVGLQHYEAVDAYSASVRTNAQVLLSESVQEQSVEVKIVGRIVSIVVRITSAICQILLVDYFQCPVARNAIRLRFVTSDKRRAGQQAVPSWKLIRVSKQD